MNFDPYLIINTVDDPLPATARFCNAIYSICDETDIKKLRRSPLFEGEKERN